MFFKLLCALGFCVRCQTHSTDDGIGGRCTTCGKIHGWVTRDELRMFADRERAAPWKRW